MRMKKAIPALPVVNIENAVKFYEERFGFKSGYHDQGFAKLLRDEVELHLWASCDKGWKYRSIFLFLKPIWSGAESFLAGTGSCRIEVENIDALYNEYKTQDVLYNKETIIEKTSWGTREFPTLDLHCNLLTFYEPV